LRDTAPANAELLHAGRFSAAELAANRAGRITLRQRLKLLKGVGALLFLAGVGLIISVAIGPNLVGAFQDLGVIGGVLVTLFFLMCLAMGVAGAFGAAMTLGDTVLGRVGTVTGEPRVKREGVTTYALARPLPSAYTYPGQFNYKLEVVDKEFDIEPSVADFLSQHGGPVHVYFAARSGELLTLEPAGE
jgi:hypothetical protein